MKRDAGFALIPVAASAVIRALHATARIRHVRTDGIDALNAAGRNYVYAFWHAQLLLMVYARFARPATVMISQHRDGEMIAATMRRFGIDAARGSTTRGGSEALRAMVRAAGEGRVLIFTPDGPRGPRHQVQPGVVRAAQIAGVPIVPGAFVARSKKRLSSWDRFEVPYPFTRALFIYGEPIEVPRALSEDRFEEIRAGLERTLVSLSEEGERDFEILWAEAKK